MFNKLFIILSLFLMLTGYGIAKGPHTDTTIYRGTTKLLTGVCSACHVAHEAKGTRLWPVTVEDTSGVSSIQNLCMTCHKRNDEDADGKGGFFVGDHDAHILSRAHGQNGTVYEGTAKKRWGPGHLYRDTCMTRYGEYVTGYVAMGYPSYESIACYADPYETGKDNLMLPRLSCTSCHDPHAEYIVGNYRNRQGLHETYESTADNYILDVVGDSTLSTTYYTAGVPGRTREVCMACHGSSNDSSKIKIDGLTPLQPTSGVSAHGTASSSKCTDCHPWDWPPVRCDGCHGNPPSAISDAHYYQSDYLDTSEFPAFTQVGVGAHDTHVGIEGYTCEVCHYNYAHYNGTVDVRFNTNGVTFPGETKIRPADTCINYGGEEEEKVLRCIVGCHEPSAEVGGIDDSTEVPWPTVAVYESSVYTLVSCVSCHDAVGDIFESTFEPEVCASSHPYVTASTISERNSCEICHRDHKWAEYDSFSKKWKGNDDPYGIYPGDTVRHRLHASMFGGFTSTFEWNPLVFNSTDAPDVNNPSVGSPCSGFCNPCHDVTPFKITYESGMVHDTSCAPFESVDYCYSAPMAARFFYESTIAGSGGHGQSSTQVAGHKMKLKCRDCHRYHGSSIGKILYEFAIRPYNVDTHKFEGFWKAATGNDNTFCYRCHFFKYDNGFYSMTAFELSIHNGATCISCHEPHGGYGWNTVTVFDTLGFSGFTRAGTRESYVDSSKYGTAVNLGDEALCFRCHNDISDYFNTTSGSHHRVYKDEQKKGGPLGNTDNYLIIECINCHNPHTVRKDTEHDSVVTNLMYPFKPAEFMSDTAVGTDSTLEYKVYNKFCLECHDEGSETNADSGMIYKDEDDSTYGKLPRGIRFSNKTKWGEADTTFHRWNKAAYYNSTGHGRDSTLSIDGEPLARLGSYGLSCGRINEFACHDPHGNTTNVSLLKTNVKHPRNTDFAVSSKHNYSTPHIYDSTDSSADEAKNTDRWCAAACHQIGKRTDEKDLSHAFTYVRKNEAPTGVDAGVYETSFGSTNIRDIDIYDTANIGTDPPSVEPVLNSKADRDMGVVSMSSHLSYSRVPGNDNNWPDNGNTYLTTYQMYLPAKIDSDNGGNRFVCFTCHDPHGTLNSAMIRCEGKGGICGKCHFGCGSCHPDVLPPDPIPDPVPGPPVADGNTLLLLHLNGYDTGTSKERPIETAWISYVASRTSEYGMGISFDSASSRLIYPLWTNESTGLPGQPGVQHDPVKDLTLRFNGDLFGEDGDEPSASSQVSFVEGYIGSAADLRTGNTLTYSSTNIDVSEGSFEAWVKIGNPGTGIQNVAEDRYIFLHTTSREPYKNAIFLRHSSSNTWDVGVSDETGLQSVVSVMDGLTSGWHHIAGTWSKTNKQLKLYIDGAFVAQNGWAQYFPTALNSTFRIGSSSATGGAINTAIDEVQISNYAKTDTEILEDYRCQNEMNFNPKRGTLMFWVKPYWDGNDGVYHCFFWSAYDDVHYFWLWKTGTNLLEFNIGENIISWPVDSTNLPKDKWSHIAASWEDFGPGHSKMMLYLNGDEVGSCNTATMMGYVDTTICFGSSESGDWPVHAVMDEIWITNVMWDSSDIASGAAGYSNANADLNIPVEIYLPNLSSSAAPGLLLHYDTTFNGADGEVASSVNVSLVSAKFDSGALVTSGGYLSYPSAGDYQELSSGAGVMVKHFNNSLGSDVLNSTGITFETGFLGGSNGAVLVDSTDVLSFSSGEISPSEPGLVGLWHMDSSWVDSKGTNNGTPYVATFSESSKVGSHAGSFNGTGAYVDLPDGFANFTTGFTIELWCYPTSVASWQRFIDFANGQGNNNILFARSGTSNDLCFEVYIGGTSGGKVTATGAIQLNTWQHFVATEDNYGNINLYKNGNQIKTGVTGVPQNVTRVNNYIGKSNWRSDGYYGGLIDEIAIYNRALNPAEIYNHFIRGDTISKTSGTVQTWVNVNSEIRDITTHRYIFRTTTDAATSANQIAIYHHTGNLWTFHTSMGTRHATASISDNLPYGWHNFAGTWDASSINLYVDGDLVKSQPSPQLPVALAGKYYIGCGGTGGQVNTTLDEFLLDTTVKTQAQIRANIAASSYNYNASSGTIEMWMKPEGWNGSETANRHYFFDAKPYPDSDTSRISLYYDTSQKIRFDVYSSTGDSGFVSYNAVNLDSSTFSHYVGTWGTTGVNLYVNGSLAGSAALVGTPGKRAGQLFIGSDANTDNGASSIIDEVQIFDVDKSVAAGGDYTTAAASPAAPSPPKSYLLNPGSLGLLLHYDTTFNGADGEIASSANVSFDSARFDSGASIAWNGYLSYPSMDGHHELSNAAGAVVKHFNNSLGDGVFSSTGVTFTDGFLGGSNGAVWIDGSDVLSFNSNGEISPYETGLLALWHLNEGQGTNLTDSKGSATGTLSGASWSTADRKFGNSAIQATVSDQYAFANVSGLPAGNSPRTIECWFKPTNYDMGPGVVGSVFGYRWTVPPAFGRRFDVVYSRSGLAKFGLYFWNTPLVGFELTVPTPFEANNWYHLVATYDGSSARLYVNGRLGAETGIGLDTYVHPTYNFCILGQLGDLTNRLGVIDEVAVYNRALDSSEVYGHYARGISKAVGTIQMWVNVNAGIKNTGVSRYIFRTTTDTAASANQIALYHDTSNLWVFHTSMGINHTMAAVPDNLSYGWHNFAGTYDADYINLYIDGNLEASRQNPCLPVTLADRYYVGSGGETNTHINTALDEFLLDTTAKTASQILANMIAGYNYNAASGTIEMWMKPVGWDSTETTKRHYFFDARPDPISYTSRISLYYDTTKKIKFDVYSSTGTCGSVSFDAAGLEPSTFRHYAGTWDKSTVNLYINGSLVNNTTWAGAPDKKAYRLFIGNSADTTCGASSIIDEVRIFDTVRDSAQIAADAGGLNDYKGYYADIFGVCEGGSWHPVNYDVAGFEASGLTDVSKMECLKCHLHGASHGGEVTEFVNVDSSMGDDRVAAYNNSTKSGVTLFCLSCHMREDIDFSTVTVGVSGYTFSGPAPAHGGKPPQLRPLENGKPKASYYPIDTASAHFDSSFGSSAVGGLSCTDCHDPHASINKSLLQDFEEAKDGRDYNKDGVMTRTVDTANVRNYQLNEEEFCYFCHDGTFNKMYGNYFGAVNPPGSVPGDGKYWVMKNIEYKFKSSDYHHTINDNEQDDEDAQIECTNCHNPHTARRDAIVLNQQTGERAYVTTTAQMNSFCIGCHGDSTTSPAVLTSWSKGVKFPGLSMNTTAAEWSGNLWNEFNKQSMVSDNEHYNTVSCAVCHDPHGSSNYRGLVETAGIYGLKLMPQTKPDGRVRYEVYSTLGGTGYGINKFCFVCHKSSLGASYPGEDAYTLWDFGIVDSSSKYSHLTKYDLITSGGYTYPVPDIYGKDKDCDYCHSPHGSDSTREHMVRDNVPQDMDRNSPDYGDRIDENDWFQKGFSATGVDFCLSKGCHVSNMFAKLGPGDIYYQPDSCASWKYKGYDQFNLLDYGSPGALGFSGVRDGTRTSRHPIVACNETSEVNRTVSCLSCHTPHGSPGNTELAKSYGGASYETAYPVTYPQDNASLRQAYYRRIYWWPVTFWKRGDPSDKAFRRSASTKYGSANWHVFGAAGSNWSVYGGNDVAGNPQDDRYFSPFNQYTSLPGGALMVNQNAPVGGSGTIGVSPGHPLRYAEKVMDSTVPSAGNDLCFMCHEKNDIVGTNDFGIDTTKTMFIGHEAVIGGAQIGETEFDTFVGRGPGLNLDSRYDSVPNDFHEFTCSMCHGPHAVTNEKLITNKCFAYNKQKPPQKKWHDLYYHPGRPSVYCHPYDNSGSPNWNTWRVPGDEALDPYSCTTYYGWRELISGDSIVPVFDTTWHENDSSWIIDDSPASPESGARTGTTASIKFLTGEYGDDNIFKLGDRMTFYFRMLKSSDAFSKPETDIPLDNSGIGGDFETIDPNSDTSSAFGGYRYYGNGLYSFYYVINGNPPGDETPYNTVSNVYDSLHRAKIIIKDKAGNTAEDTTYQCILDNMSPSWPE